MTDLDLNHLGTLRVYWPPSGSLPRCKTVQGSASYTLLNSGKQGQPGWEAKYSRIPDGQVARLV